MNVDRANSDSARMLSPAARLPFAAGVNLEHFCERGTLGSRSCVDRIGCRMMARFCQILRDSTRNCNENKQLNSTMKTRNPTL